MQHQQCPLHTPVLSFSILSLYPVLCLTAGNTHYPLQHLSREDKWRTEHEVDFKVNGPCQTEFLLTLLIFNVIFTKLCVPFLFPPFQFVNFDYWFFIIFTCYSLVCLILSRFCPPKGQRASWDHPTGEPQHQGSGRAQKTCESFLSRDHNLCLHVCLTVVHKNITRQKANHLLFSVPPELLWVIQP